MFGILTTVKVPLVDTTPPNCSVHILWCTAGSATLRCTCPNVTPASLNGASCAYAGCAVMTANAISTVCSGLMGTSGAIHYTVSKAGSKKYDVRSSRIGPQRTDPDVPVAHRVAMILQGNRALGH